MIHKNDLKNKYVEYRDKEGATRTNKVVKITGNVLTVKDVVGVRRRVKKEQVLGRCFRKRGLEEIKWSR
ncbi:hypothetical protein KKH23_07800 [Patescibacteria group bacterium]|nr:hypothetical protein [Patescibacteria group bacterium]MBU1067215.1 hypothetical protein [Patescibacteria group bacterium]